MKEPLKYKSVSRDDLGGATPFGNYYYFFGSEILRRDIEILTFSDKISIPENVLGSIDVSERQNGSVMAWYTDNDFDGNYEMVVAQEGGVVANPDSSYLFCEIGWLGGTEHLYTSDVVDMSYMFSWFGILNYGVQGEVYLDMGDNFDTSSVENMENMFREAAPWQHLTIRFGKAFCVDNVKSAVCAFEHPGIGQCAVVVSNESVYNWLLAPRNYIDADESIVTLETN